LDFFYATWCWKQGGIQFAYPLAQARDALRLGGGEVVLFAAVNREDE
jgi:hypothetical protein